jgi:hypothetical protein
MFIFCALIKNQGDTIFEFSRFKKEAAEWSKLIFSMRGFWVFLPGFATVLAVYFIDLHAVNEAGESVALFSIGKSSFLLKDIISTDLHEKLAIGLLSITTVVFLSSAVAYRFEIDFVLLALSAAFLCREIKFDVSKEGVYIAAGLIGIWSGFHYEKLLKELERSTLVKIVLFGTGWSYLFTLIIQRRIFKSIFRTLHMDGLLAIEKNLHTLFEESTETTAHLFFLLLAIVCFTLSKQKNHYRN